MKSDVDPSHSGRLLIGGKWLPGSRAVEIRSPWDGQPAGVSTLADADLLEQGVRAAVAGYHANRDLPRWRRSEICRKISNGLLTRHEQFAQLITAESGKPLQYARAEVTRAVSTFAIAAEEANRLCGEIIPLDITAAGEPYSGYSLRVPIGPVAAVSPFNFPLNLVAHKVAPALACGCSVLLKPAPQTPLTAMLLGEVIEETGAPSGAFNVLPMEVPLAEQMVRDERFALLTFTGSASVGWRLKSICGRKKTVLELGGNAGAIVHEDADLDWAVQRLVLGAYANSGQVCIKAQRIFIHNSLFERFLQQFVYAAERLKIGDPTADDTVVGPLISKAAADRVENWIKEAVAGGASVLTGGNRERNLVYPTALTGATPKMKVSCEEIFGPVAVLAPYTSLEEAIAGVNDSPYGLQAAVFTRDLQNMRMATSKLHVGGVIVNDSPMVRVDNYPYGGSKASGLGREGVRYAMEDMTESRMVVVRE